MALEPHRGLDHLEELARLYRDARIRRWGVWLDGRAGLAQQRLSIAGMVVTNASPGMGADIDSVLAATTNNGDRPNHADLATVGRVNDVAYGNYDGRLERTLQPLPNGVLHGYKADLDGKPAAVALALHHTSDCGISFVATVPKARRKGLATQVMRQALQQARNDGCTTTTLQATDVGERLYTALGYKRLTEMQLWEKRP